MKMKACVLPLACLISFGAAAKSYVNLGYGVSSSQNDHAVTFTNTGTSVVEQSVKPRESDDSFNVTIGIDSGPNTAVELSFTNYRSSTDQSTYNIDGTNPGNTEIRTYEAQMTRNQFSITPVYYKPINNKMTVKGGLGLVYTQYEFSGFAEYQIGANEEIPLLDVRASNHTSDEYGLIGVAGFDYALMEGITVGSQAHFTYDKIATNSAIYATLGFRF